MLTTYIGISLGVGYEANPFIAYFLDQLGFVSLIIVKLLFCILLYKVYIHFTQHGQNFFWKLTKYVLGTMGLIIVINNSFVILGYPDIYNLLSYNFLLN